MRRATNSRKATFSLVLTASITALPAFAFIAAQKGRFVPRQNTKVALLASAPARLRPVCPKPKYTRVKPPDEIAKLLTERKRYRLVIGAGEFRDQPQFNRAYVGETAKLIDEQLDSLGYTPLPSLKNRPYLIGQDANKATITAALEEMAKQAGQEDIGIIYYIGHGTVTHDHTDLALAVWDRPIAPDEGVRVSEDLIGLLTVNEYRSNIREVPHFVVVLETCYSGNIAIASQTMTVENNGLQTVEATAPRLVIPNQIAILAATAEGDNTQAYALGDTNFSAFGYYFTRALSEDWACADKETPDGILTLTELQAYLGSRLDLARTNGAVGKMNPQIRSDGQITFIAYSPEHHVIDGMRDRVVTLLAHPSRRTTVTLTMPSGLRYSCSRSDSKGCLIPFSKSYRGTLKVVALSAHGDTDFWSVLDAVIEYLLGLPEHLTTSTEPEGVKSDTIDIATLVKQQHAEVAGVSLEIK
jgi:hypothetical protein